MRLFQHKGEERGKEGERGREDEKGRRTTSEEPGGGDRAGKGLAFKWN
jgi:hypothetical protein